VDVVSGRRVTVCWLIAAACTSSSRGEVAFESVRTVRLAGAGHTAVQLFTRPEGIKIDGRDKIRGRCCIPEGDVPATLRALILPADAGGLPARRRPAARVGSLGHPGRCVEAHDALVWDTHGYIVAHDLHCELVDADRAGPMEVEMTAAIVGEDGQRKLQVVGEPMILRDVADRESGPTSMPPLVIP
jgi:hypothetical protein